jgi:hypothetical protein
MLLSFSVLSITLITIGRVLQRRQLKISNQSAQR